MSQLPAFGTKDVRTDAATPATARSGTDAAADTDAHYAQTPLLGRKSFARGAMIGLAIVIPFWLLVAAVLLWVL